MKYIKLLYDLQILRFYYILNLDERNLSAM